MPTVLLINGFRFFFYSNENDEPAHVHVSKADGEGKIWLEPVVNVAYMRAFNKTEQSTILEIVTTNYEFLKNKWNEFFGE